MDLVGFINPGSRFPATVIPVWWTEDDSLVGLFDSPDREPMLQRIQLKSKIFKLPVDWSDESIRGCEPIDVCLLALTADQLLAYPRLREGEILSSLLADRSFAGEEPFVRLALSKLTQMPHLIVSELVSCACRLLSKEVLAAPGAANTRIEKWLGEQRQSICERFSLDVEIPLTIDELGDMKWWRQYVDVQTPMKRSTLYDIEDITPSPKTVTILNLEPTIPDDRILGLMARHLMNGTKYTFFHSPAANKDILSGLAAATQQALESARRATTGPTADLVPPNVGEISFFALQTWTGSPYIFYEIATPNGISVIGYRGHDVGASISSCYEKLGDGVARELLEALVSPRPERMPLEGASHVLKFEKRTGETHR